ncbi:MAG: arginase family protein [Proteobacteria bacterium]|nr:arginase family protein [Pseudomonadota bacterium]
MAVIADDSPARRARDELAAMLRPVGGGLYVVSTGRAEQLAVQRGYYGVADEAAIDAKFRATLDRIATARAVILGVPSDVGAGYRRGANLGPQGIRGAMLDADPGLRTWLDDHGVIDIGDVAVCPQLLHDDMLAPAQIAATRQALYRDLPAAFAATLPVSPLSIEERALAAVYALNPAIVPIVLGGDHSVAWPVAAALAAHRTDRWSIVQPDAHTDLLAERLGVKYCFATWSYHANELLGRDGRLVQVGVRASRYPREHWERELGVRQLWANEIAANPEQAIEDMVAHLRARGVTSVYFSNDIDGTDARWASATGTPEADGLTPTWLLALIDRLGREFGFCAVDCVEVAPPLGPTSEATRGTLELAARYVRACLAQIVAA